MTASKEKLFSEFSSVSTDEWMAKITADLKGAPFDKKLIWKTTEGFDVKPFYRKEDIEGLRTATSLPGEFPYVRGTKRNNDWKIRQNIVVADMAQANAQALDLLQKGINSLGFVIDEDQLQANHIASLLAGINPEVVELDFSTCNCQIEALVGLVADYFESNHYDLNKCVGSFNYDAFKKPLLKGKPAADWVQQATGVLNAAKRLPRYRALSVNAIHINNAGSYIFQELGYALAWGNEILAKTTEAGFAAADVAKKIKFNWGISANYFLEIAKFRAARWLWAQIVAAYEPICTRNCPNNQPDGLCRCACKMVAHAHTSTWNMTLYDSYVNLLRSQTEAMAAAIAGVDSIAVEPFNSIYETPNAFSERIARNQQLLLKEECHFDKVVDPSAGSYYIEVLTDSIAQEAWKLFLELEEQGGFYEALVTGSVQNAVNQSATSRKQALATRREILLGTNQYPNFAEVANDKIQPTACCACGCNSQPTLPLMDFTRGAADFEALRLATEKSGNTPKVFMLTIGHLAMRLARSQFASNFFACAGYQPIDNLGFETIEQGVEAALKACAQIVVLCSSDDEYAEFAPQAYALLEGKAELVIAGAPACADELKAKGIHQFIHVKSNVLETLKAFNTKLGIV